MLYFIGLFFFLKKKTFFNVRTKRVHETDLFLKVPTYFIPNYSSLVSLATYYFTSNRISLNVCTKYFITPLFEVKNIIHNKKNIYILYAISRGLFILTM